MIKTVTSLKKKAGLSNDEFRAYYESRHRLIGEKYLKGYATRYIRRYLDPVPDSDGILREPEFDVLLEIWFPDIATWRACSETLNSPAAMEEIIEDEERMFDRSRKRTYLVEEIESRMGHIAT